MKEVKAIIQPHMLSRVLNALHALPHFPGLTVSDCQGQGHGHGTGGHFEATQESIFLARRVKVEVFCDDALCDDIVAAIQHAAHTGNSGDGFVVVIDAPRIIRIRNGQPL